MKKIAILLLTVVVLFSTVQIPFGMTGTQSYYSGDAVNYKGQIIIGTTNTGYLELFKLEDNKLYQVAKFKPDNKRFGTKGDFYDLALHVEIGRLYVYATSGSEIYKYDASNFDNIRMLNFIKDTSYDWVGDLDVVNGQLITKGTNGVKVWNRGMKVVDSYKITNEANPYNIVFSKDYNRIFNVTGGLLQIFDRKSRQVVKNIDVSHNSNTSNRLVYDDANSGMIYTVDGKTIKKFNYAGDLHKSAKHEITFGYDVIASIDNEHLYVSTGLGIKKIRKDDLSLVDQFNNVTSLGYWSMGIKAVSDAGGEKIIGFNNASITVFDHNLDILTYVRAVEKEKNVNPRVNSKLSLNTDKKGAMPFENITLYGSGFAPNEALKITLGEQKITAYTGDNGKFVKKFKLAPAKAGIKDIKVVGEKSKVSYSLTFEIKEIVK